MPSSFFRPKGHMNVIAPPACPVCTLRSRKHETSASIAHVQYRANRIQECTKSIYTVNYVTECCGTKVTPLECTGA